MLFHCYAHLITAKYRAEKVGADIVECACVIELPDLNGRSKLGKHDLFVLIEKEGA
jgi:adenine phosphoribosyltransferase